MNRWDRGRRPLTIAILAMGGEGGGVLSDWIVAVGEKAGYHAQSTSVAGVAQRTGATVYYVELYPPSPAEEAGGARSEPVLSLFPTPGQVDVVIASELMEAGRAIQRGFCTPDRTTLIASINRVYAITEKIDLGEGRADDDVLLAGAHAGARRLVAADFSLLAAKAKSVISASLFGALAGAQVLPFPREAFEEAIRQGGKGVDRSLAAFALGFEAAQQPAPQPQPAPSGLGPVRVTIGRRRPQDPEAEAALAAQRRHEELAQSEPRRLVGRDLVAQADRASSFPAAARSMILHGIVRTAVYQDPRYADLYLDRVARVAGFDAGDEAGELAATAARLTDEVARHTALWMSYQDTIHVALQKLRARRLDHVREEAKAERGQMLDVREFLHPQVDEIADMLPTALGRWVARSRTVGAVIGRITRDGMIVNTTSVFGYSILWALASFRPLRPRSLRYEREQHAIDEWLDAVVEVAAEDYALACAAAELPRVLKGYGETHAHGNESFGALMGALAQLRGRADAADVLARLTKAALADEDGTALAEAIGRMAPVPA